MERLFIGKPERKRDMNEKISKYIEGLFAKAPKTRKAMELREEMTQNTIEKYQDLISEGYQEEDAFQNVISSIGDVTELFEDLEEKNNLFLSEKDRKKKALICSAAVGLYIFAVAVFLCGMAFGEIYFPVYPESEVLVLALTVVLCIPPTCMLVYAAQMYPDYHRKENTLVENYKEAVHARNKEKSIKASISSIIWLAVLIFYFVISFMTSKWEITWITFLVGGCGQAILVLVFSLRQKTS